MVNPLHEELRYQYNRFVKDADNKIDDPYRLAFHVMSPVGWLNDPNGVCMFQGTYHLYYQYSPYDASGGLKYWGHYSSKDLVHFEDQGLALLPDQPYDLHGVYSGSAFIKDDVIHYFYTGNVKHLGDHDYVTSGREQNTVHAVSLDGGYTIEKKNVVIHADDYPEEMSNHIRDPKVREINGAYYMVLGARDKEDQGQILVYKSSDLDHWTYHGVFLGPKDDMGYMWECPDFLEVDGKDVIILSPQGVKEKGEHFNNVYQSGYYLGGFQLDPLRFEPETDFKELDRGFDFYAPQTFTDQEGRQILWGWMGMPDATYENPTIESGWQHAMTLPRVLSIKDNQLIQQPHENYQALRKNKVEEHLNLSEGTYHYLKGKTSECLIRFHELEEVSIVIKEDVTLSYSQQSGKLILQLGASGYGRKRREVSVGSLKHLQLFIDTSSLEIFVNEGMHVLTTRMYPDVDADQIELTGKCDATIECYQLGHAQK